jgi:branched-chain amino acid transport system substrate-binding protein
METEMKKIIAAAVTAMFICAGPATAQEKISNGIVKIAVLTDMSGLYADNVGAGSVLATRMAVEDFGGQVLGKPIQVVTADHQNKADIASTKVREWIDRDQVDVITELGSSAVALAAMKIGTEKNRITMVTGAGATRISGEDCTATNLHWVYDTYALANVASKSLVEAGGKSWYFIAADYAFGHALENDGTKVIKASGGTVLGSARYPIPGNDFGSFLLRAQASKADVVALANAGMDTQIAIKQAREFGLTEKQKVVAMLMSIADVHSLGLAQAKGMYFTESFYWDLNDEARKFSRRFFENHKRMPTALQAGQYSAVLTYLKAVQAAGTDDTAQVMKAIKSMPVNDAFAKNGKVRADGKMVHDMYLVEVKAPNESKTPWDYYRIVKTVPGELAFAPLSESQCPLAKK